MFRYREDEKGPVDGTSEDTAGAIGQYADLESKWRECLNGLETINYEELGEMKG